MSETTRTETDAVREIAAQATRPEELDTGRVYALAGKDGTVLTTSTDAWAEHPRRAEADRIVYDSASFATYLAKHGTPEETEVFADVQTATIVAVVDSHGGAGSDPGWQKHRITLALTKSPAWLAWEKHDGELLPQARFAELIELQAPDVHKPTAADLLDLAQTFSAQKDVDYVSSERLADGQIRLRYEETISAKAGQKGDVEIPSRIELVVRPYIGAPPYRIGARFRYRIDRDQHLSLGYVLERPHLVLEAAFGDVVAALRTGGAEENAAKDEPTPFPAVEAPIFQGRP
jgi:uncharacterized protein YfdQ (DUF2303 family)